MTGEGFITVKIISPAAPTAAMNIRATASRMKFSLAILLFLAACAFSAESTFLVIREMTARTISTSAVPNTLTLASIVVIWIARSIARQPSQHEVRGGSAK